MRRQNANQGQWDRRHDDQWRNERAEPAHYQDVDQYQDSGKSQSQVAEHFDRDVPLAVPLHGEAVGALGHGRALVLLDRVAIGQLDLVDGVAHLHDGVDRAFFSAGHVSSHVHHGLQVLAINAGIDRGLLEVGDLAQRNLSAGRGGQLEVLQVLDSRAIGARQADFDGNVFAGAGIVQKAGIGAGQSNLQRARDIGGRDSMQRCLIEIHVQRVLGLRILNVPVHIHDSGSLLKDLFDLRGQFDLAFVIGAVDFRDLDARTERLGNLIQFRAQAARDFVTLSFAVVPRQQVDLNVGLVGLAAQEVMPHEAVEVVGAGCAGIYLVIGDFGLLAEIAAERLRYTRRLLEGSSVGHVDDDLEFALVVEGEHFYSHPFQRHEGNCGEQEHDDSTEKHPAATGIPYQRVHHAAIEIGRAH